MNIMILIKLLFVVLFFVIYKWIIVFIHELGHFTISILLGNKSKIEFHMRRNLMPTMHTKISSKRNLEPFEDILITSGGVLFQVIVTIILLSQNISVEINKISTFYLMSIFLNVVPVKATDGYHLNKILKENKLINELHLIKMLTLIQWLIPLNIIIFTFIDIVKMSIIALKTWNFYLFGLSILGYIIAITSIVCIEKFYNKKSEY